MTPYSKSLQMDASAWDQITQNDSEEPIRWLFTWDQSCYSKNNQCGVLVWRNRYNFIVVVASICLSGNRKKQIPFHNAIPTTNMSIVNPSAELLTGNYWQYLQWNGLTNSQIVSLGALLKLFRKGFMGSATTSARQRTSERGASHPARCTLWLKDQKNGSGLLLVFLLDGLGGLNFLGRPHFSWRSAFWPSACLVALIITTAPLCMIPYLQPHIIHISPKLSHRRSTHILLGRRFLISHHLIDFSIVLASET